MVGDTVKFTVEQSAWTFYHQNFEEKIAFNRVEIFMKKPQTNIWGKRLINNTEQFFLLSLAINIVCVCVLMAEGTGRFVF